MELENLLGLGVCEAQIARMQGNPRFHPRRSAIEYIPQNRHISVGSLRADLVVATGEKFDLRLSFGLAMTAKAGALTGRLLNNDRTKFSRALFQLVFPVPLPFWENLLGPKDVALAYLTFFKLLH